MFSQQLIFISSPATLLFVLGFLATAILWRIFGKERALILSIIDAALAIASFAVMLILGATLADMLILLLFAAAAHLVLIRARKEDGK